MPTIAECGGFLYLQKELEDADGQVWEMTGVLDGSGFRTNRLQRFGYAVMTAKENSMLFEKGESIPVHEFHYWDCTQNGTAFEMKKPVGNKILGGKRSRKQSVCRLSAFIFSGRAKAGRTVCQGSGKMAGKAKGEGIVNLERLSNQLNQISEPDKKAASEAKQRWDSVAKPLGSLGLLEDALIRIAALTGSADIDLSVRRLYLMCADNGVVAQNVTQTGSEVTARMADSFAAGKSSACRMAKVANCQVEAVDLGILNYPGNPGVRNCRIANGTADITQKPAMTKAELYRCIETGIGLVKCAKEDRVKLLVTGEMGIGNTTTSSAVASVLLGCDPLLVTGRGAGLSDSGLSRKLEAIKKAIKLHHPDPEDPLSVLSMLGGFDIAGMVGLYLGGALYQVPVLIDGVISAVAALLAVKICPASKKAMLATHVSAEPAGCMILDAIGLEPMITAGMRLGEGTGALCAIPMLDMACSVYQGSTFGELSIEAYEEQGSQL